jgi:pyridoxal biosynthesis lyase PdxS
MRNGTTAVVTGALTIVLAGIFIASGIYKSSDPAAFQVSYSASRSIS